MNFIINTFAFLLMLPLIVFVHELGHYLLAKFNGVKVEAFSIGFGKGIWSWKDKSGTEWKIGWLPLGGYVRIFGQADTPEKADEKTGKIKKLTVKEKKVHFEFKNRLQKASIVFAGPFFNILFTFLTFFLLFAFIGRSYIPAVVGEVKKDSPAFVAGIKKDDAIFKINDEQIESFSDIAFKINLAGGDPIKVTVKRNKKDMDFVITPKKMEERYILGIASKPSYDYIKELSVKDSVVYAYKDTNKLFKNMLKGLSRLLTGKVEKENVGGMISIAKVSGDALKAGLYSFFLVMAFISLNLALINLLPIPILDGGYLVIYAIESVIRRNIPEKAKELMFLGGFIFLMVVMLYANLNDVVKLFK